MELKPSLFIASASESLVVARALQGALEDVAEVSVWDQAQFRPMKFPLESLLEILDKSDLGVFVFAPDERHPAGNGQRPVVRDNVLIELGLFIGRMGRDRVAVVVRDDVQPHIPSDLNGLTLLKYRFDRADRNLAAAVAPAAELIRMMLSDLPNWQAVRAPEFDLPRMTLRTKLSRNQQSLLKTFEGRSPWVVEELRAEFAHWSHSELHYRLEQLRLYSFLHLPNPGAASQNPGKAQYQLHKHYAEELRRLPPILEHDSGHHTEESVQRQVTGQAPLSPAAHPARKATGKRR